MNCVICKHGQTVAQTITVTLERNAMTLVFKSVPAQVCENCGEEYVAAETTKRLFQEAERASGEGIELEVRQFAA